MYCPQGHPHDQNGGQIMTTLTPSPPHVFCMLVLMCVLCLFSASVVAYTNTTRLLFTGVSSLSTQPLTVYAKNPHYFTKGLC